MAVELAYEGDGVFSLYILLEAKSTPTVVKQLSGLGTDIANMLCDLK
jgi:23S rRNA maturation mini-RNase III